MKDFKIDEKVAKDFGEYLKKIRDGLDIRKIKYNRKNK